MKPQRSKHRKGLKNERQSARDEGRPKRHFKGKKHHKRDHAHANDAGPQPRRREREAIPTQSLEAARDATAKKIKDWLASGVQLRDQRLATPSLPTNELKLDPWQNQAFEALQSGSSVIVDAPTTAGKTRVVESFFAKNIDRPGFRAAYTTPVKSLSNDKLRELRAMFGRDRVGIATGDIKENLDAPIVVATLESYRNSLLGVEPDLGRTLVVFDEYHFLQDESRGSAWEEALILTPKNCQILMLSASVANAEDFKAWMARLTHKNIELIRTTVRPVPLTHLICVQDEWLLADEVPPTILERRNARLMEMPLRLEELVPKVLGLETIGLTPCILYAGRRMACENLAFALMRNLKPLPPEQSEQIGKALQEAHDEVRSLSFIPMNMRQMMQTYGVGFHHSGLAPPARIGVEKLVKKGLLRYCAATMGLSVGINFAVRSALITDYTRPGEAGFTDYTPSEVLQMLGRAGRRGSDVVGFSLWPTVESFHKLAGARREVCESRLRNDPTTFLGLVGRGFSLGAIQNFYEKSFRRFKDPKADLSIIRKNDIQNVTGSAEIPCSSPAAETARFWSEDPDALCRTCKWQRKCHDYVERRAQGTLAHLHLHLHAIGALHRDESLTSFGSLARYFPQAGGLVFAKAIADGEITADRLLRACELAAAFSLARFKEPGTPDSYRFPWDARQFESRLGDFYPVELFPEVYDFGNRGPGKRSRNNASDGNPVIREFNPAAGYIVRAWLEGAAWSDLVREVGNEFFGVGDVMAVLYRTATWMQSLVQAKNPELSSLAGELREQLLREPLSFTLSI